MNKHDLIQRWSSTKGCQYLKVLVSEAIDFPSLLLLSKDYFGETEDGLIDLRGITVRGDLPPSCLFSHCSFMYSTFSDLTINRGILAYSNFAHTVVSNVLFEDCDITESIWGGSQMSKVVFRKGSLNGASFRGVVFDETSLIEVDAAVSNFVGADLNGLSIEKSSFDGSVFSEDSQPFLDENKDHLLAPILGVNVQK